MPPLQGFLLAWAQGDAGESIVIHAAKIRFFRVKSERRDNFCNFAADLSCVSYQILLIITKRYAFNASVPRFFM